MLQQMLFAHRGASGLSTLNNGLLALWAMGEASGNHLPSVGTTTLTQHGETQAAGPGAGTFSSRFDGSSNYASAASSADTLAGNVSRTWGAKFKVRTLPGAFAFEYILAKFDSTFGLEYGLSVFFETVHYNLRAEVRSQDGSVYSYVDVDVSSLIQTAGTPTLAWLTARMTYDHATGTLSLKADNGTAATASHLESGLPAGVRAAPATFNVGAKEVANSPAAMDLALIGIWDRAFTGAEDAEWAGITSYPFDAEGALPADIAYLIDNTEGLTDLDAGTPVPLWVDEVYPGWPSVRANAGNLRVKDADDNLLTTWIEKANKGYQFARPWFPLPAAVPVGETLAVKLACLARSETLMPGAYDSLFSKAVADGSTAALWHFDEASGNAVDDVAGYALALTGGPVRGDSDGGNFRLRAERQAFATGSCIDLNGGYLVSSGARPLSSPGAAGCIVLWLKPRDDSAPFPQANYVVLRVVNASGESLDVRWDTASGSKAIVYTITSGGVAHVARLDFGGLFAPYVWSEWAFAWGADGMRIAVNGLPHAVNTYAGTFGAGTLEPLTVGAAYGGSVFGPFLIDQLEVRTAQPTRTELLRRFSRGGPSLSEYEYAAWQHYGSDSVVIAPTLTEEGTACGEPRVIRTGANAYVMIYGGNAFLPRIFRAHSTNGVNWTKDGWVFAQGLGGWAGDAARQNVFDMGGGTWVMTFSDAVAEGANIAYATSADQGMTWAYVGLLLAPDSVHEGWANHHLELQPGGSWEGLCEYRTGGNWLVDRVSSPDLVTPWTVEGPAAVVLTTQRGLGNISARWFKTLGDYVHYFVHFGDQGSLPSAILHYRGRQIAGPYEPVSGGDAIVDLASSPVLADQDQVADVSLILNPDVDATTNPEGNRIFMYHDTVRNASPLGPAAVICLRYRVGGWDVLDQWYPRVRPG